jgi:hypothetical protein
MARVMIFLERIAAYVYRRAIRPWLPVKATMTKAAIVSCLDRHVGDDYVPARWLSTLLFDDPTYEYALVCGLRSHVHAGDKVIVVGGGLGITAALAAQLVGPQGSVICYEGSLGNVANVLETARRNDVADRITVKHAVVGANLSVYGSTGNCGTVRAEDLPPCDVLELDCEGAERQILQEMLIRPRIILVETHGIHGSSSAACASLLQKIGYQVTNLGVAEPSLHQFCVDSDIVVLVGQVSDGVPEGAARPGADMKA